MQICRICLATDRKTFRIGGRVNIYEQITGLSFSSEDVLPKNVCWECWYYMSKYVAFKSRAVMSYCTLMEILKKDGLITESSLENCSESTLTSTNTLCFSVQEEYDNLIVYDNSDKTVDIKDESVNNFEDDSSIKDETSFSDDVFVSSANIADSDSVKEYSCVEKRSPDKLTKIKRKRKAKATEIIKDKKSLKGKSKKSNKITKQLAVKRNKVATVKEKKDVKLCIDELDKELFQITELLTLDEQIAEIQRKKQSDNYLNSPHSCDNCYKGFHDFAAYKRHITRYSETRGPHACPVCRMRFKQPVSLNAHIRNHAYKISCTQCNFSTSYLTAAKHHQNFHKGKTYKCPHCEEVFRHNSTYLGHLRIKHPSDFICKHCGYTFLNERGLKQHLFRNHKDDQEVPLDGPVCARCSVRFSCQDALDTHRRVSAHHADERTAGVVKPARNSTPKVNPKFRYGSAKSRKSVLSSEPFPEGPKPCELCKKLLPNPKVAFTHMKNAHQSTKSQQNQSTMCWICGKLCRCGETLQSSMAYKNHFAKTHKGMTRTRYFYPRIAMCEICGKFFQNEYFLRDHMNAHSSTKKFKCDQCSKLFQTEKLLYSHRRHHCGTNRVKYPCTVCGKTFSSLGNMQRHKGKHSGAQFKCQFCDKVFHCQGNMKVHIDFVHMKKPLPKRNRRRRIIAEPQSKVMQSPADETETDVEMLYVQVQEE